MFMCDLLMLQGIYHRRVVIDDDIVCIHDSTLYGVDVYKKLCVYGGLFSATDNTFSKDGLRLLKKFVVNMVDMSKTILTGLYETADFP